MQASFGLQSNHSDYMRLVATLGEEKKAGEVYARFVRLIHDLFKRADQFPCASFGRAFSSMREYREWKRREWDPIADRRCRLKVERRNGGVHVTGDYGLTLDDWSREQTEIALDGRTIALQCYTAGYGLDRLERWLRRRGAEVEISVQGGEYAYRGIDDAFVEIEAQAGQKRAGRVRTPKRNDRPVRPERKRGHSQAKSAVRPAG